MLKKLSIPQAYIVIEEPRSDLRGSFTRLWDASKFDELRISSDCGYLAVSKNTKQRTIRGLHVQLPPHAETKYVRCLKGAIHDVILDVRPTSPYFGRWVAVKLSAEANEGLVIPQGVAHGFQTLVDDTHVLYAIGGKYDPSSAVTINWTDPELAIEWPYRDAFEISSSDANAPLFAEVCGRFKVFS